MVKKPEAIPNTPGVYIFKRGKTPVYIGKAGNLKKRLSSYFRANVAPKVRALREEADSLTWLELGNEIGALIREAELIKQHVPKYNVLMRDDKSYFYVAFTKEKFPNIFVAHKTNLDMKRYRRVIGPFTSGSALFMTLRLLRRIFPHCTCKELHKRPCLNAQIGRCPGYCCIKSPISSSSTKQNYSLIRTNKRIVDSDSEHYHNNIRGVIGVLSGKRKRISSQLKRQMHDAAKKHEFEAAARLRDQIHGLENIFAHRRILEGRDPANKQTLQYSDVLKWKRIEREVRSVLKRTDKIMRVEGYDISNISGTAATGSMVVFVNGLPAKSLYRKFKIKTVQGANDVAMHQEMMRRRLGHKEWGMPDLVVIDGGLPQLNAVRAILRPGNTRIYLTALAKREEELYIDPIRSKAPKASADVPKAHRTSNGVEGKARPIRLDSLPREVMLFFQHVRDESHRFAKKYHHKLREIAYREKYQNQN